jgi:RND family efflux transporter MFP subunit
MKKNKLFLLFIFSLFTVIILLIINKFNSMPSGKNNKKRAYKKAKVPVETIDIRKQKIEERVSFTGTLQARSSYFAAPKIQGQLIKLNYDIGDYIKKNDLIALLDSEELDQKVIEARASYDVAKARFEAVDTIYEKLIEKAQADVSRWEATVKLSEKDLERLKKLKVKSVASETEYDKASEQLQVARSQLVSVIKSLELSKTEQKEESIRLKAEVQKQSAALKSAQVRQSYSRITAAWDSGPDKWIVGEKFKDQGEILSSGQPILSIFDINEMLSIIHVTEKDYNRIKTGQKVDIITDAFPDKVFQGNISRIAPVLDELSRKARVEIGISNPGHQLKPGMFARVEIVLSAHENAVCVPLEAIVKREDITGVFTVYSEENHNSEGHNSEGIAKFVPVKTGIRDKKYAQIVSPQITEKIITLGNHLLNDKTPVIIDNSSQGVSEAENAGERGI